MKTKQIILFCLFTLIIYSCKTNKKEQPNIKTENVDSIKSEKPIINELDITKKSSLEKVVLKPIPQNKFNIKSSSYQPVHRHFCNESRFDIEASFIKGDESEDKLGYNYNDMNFRIKNIKGLKYKIVPSSVKVIILPNKYIDIKLEIEEAGETSTVSIINLQNTNNHIKQFKKGDLINMHVHEKGKSETFKNCGTLAGQYLSRPYAPGAHYCMAKVTLK